MNRQEFIKQIADLVQRYIDNFDRFDSDPQIRVNPLLLRVDIVNGKDRLEGIGFSEEAIENAAYAEGDETESSSDRQAKENPDFYPVKNLLKPTGEHSSEPDMDAIAAIADNYYKS